MNISYKKLLKDYRSITKILREQYVVYKRDPLSKDWIKFNENVAKSLSYLYKLSIPLYDSIKNSNVVEPFEYKDTRIYSFYYDFLVSKPSNSIFTETPKDTKVNLYPRTPKAIADQFELLFDIINDYKIAKELKNLKERGFLKKFLNIFKIIYLEIKYFFIKLNLQDKDRNNFKVEFNRHFQIAFQRAFLFYDFIYYKDKGVFTKHAFSNELFMKTKEHLDNIMRNIDKNNTNVYRELYQKMVLVCIDVAISYKKDNRSPKSKLNYYDYYSIYREYVEYQELYAKNPKNLIYFEPFTYLLANKIWKFDRIYQNRCEGKDTTKNYVENIKNYLQESLEEIGKYYRNEIRRYELYEIISQKDEVIIQFMYDNYLKDIGTELKEYEQGTDQSADSQNKREIDASTILYKAIDTSKYDKFKFYRILQNGDKEEIQDLLDVFYNFIISKLNQQQTVCNQHYIGILRSGSFLAHAINIMSNNDNPVISMITHPYLTILPRERFKRDDKTKIKTIYIDETIKSGYSANIIDVYRKKILMFEQNANNDCKSELYVLVDFIDYKNKVFTDYKAL
ncbi:MAG: hypothetical protein L3J47_03305, partial [Sulfurovum sp.]|nr:hypothetical protein [Sulfurovum sp.]